MIGVALDVNCGVLYVVSCVIAHECCMLSPGVVDHAVCCPWVFVAHIVCCPRVLLLTLYVVS